MGQPLYQIKADLLKALAHPARLEIMHLLADEPQCVCELMSALELEQSVVSKHLKILRDQGLVSSQREGSRVVYRLRRPEILGLLDQLDDILHAHVESLSQLLKSPD